jgi:hypothetical protein
MLGTAKKKKKHKKKQCNLCGPLCLNEQEQCCPADYGGGTCAFNQTCCPAQKGYPGATCISPGDGHECCPAGTGGGACLVAQSLACCPFSLTNDANLGCCRNGHSCCNSPFDCNQIAGEVCQDGCCIVFF